jgi:hypothetical protein
VSNPLTSVLLSANYADKLIDLLGRLCPVALTDHKLLVALQDLTEEEVKEAIEGYQTRCWRVLRPASDNPVRTEERPMSPPELPRKWRDVMQAFVQKWLANRLGTDPATSEVLGELCDSVGDEPFRELACMDVNEACDEIYYEMLCMFEDEIRTIARQFRRRLCYKHAHEPVEQKPENPKKENQQCLTPGVGAPVARPSTTPGTPPSVTCGGASGAARSGGSCRR